MKQNYEALFLSYRPRTECSISQFCNTNCTLPMAEFILETSYPSRRIIRQADNSSKYKSEEEFYSIICLDILSGKTTPGNSKHCQNQSLLCGNFVKKPSTFHLDINLETDELSLTDESDSDEFCFIIRLSTEFILGTTYPSVTGNPFRWIIRL